MNSEWNDKKYQALSRIIVDDSFNYGFNKTLKDICLKDLFVIYLYFEHFEFLKKSSL